MAAGVAEKYCKIKKMYVKLRIFHVFHVSLFKPIVAHIIPYHALKELNLLQSADFNQ